MLKMRLQRVGRRHQPSFRLVLTEAKNATKSGRFKEILGSYDPRQTNEAFNLERINYWLSQGVSTTPTIHNLLVRHQVIKAKKINVSAVSKKTPVANDVILEAAPTALDSAEVTASKEVEVPAEEVQEEPAETV